MSVNKLLIFNFSSNKHIFDIITLYSGTYKTIEKDQFIRLKCNFHNQVFLINNILV